MSDIQSMINEQKNKLMRIRDIMIEKNVPERVVDKVDSVGNRRNAQKIREGVGK